MEAALLALGDAAIRAMVKKYEPEVFWKFGAPHSLARRLSRLLRGSLPAEAAAEMLTLRGADVVGATCHWLGVRLQRMPWARELRRRSFRELRALFYELRIDDSDVRVRSSRRFVAKILASASQDHSVKERLLRELGMSRRTSSVEPVGYIDECPDAVRSALDVGGVFSAPTSCAILTPRFEAALAAMGPGAMEAMVKKFMRSAGQG